MPLISLVLLTLLSCGRLVAESALPSFATTSVNGEVLHANTLTIAGMTFRDVTARPVFRAATATLLFESIEAKAYRGRIRGTYGIELGAEPHRHHCRFDLEGVDLAVLAPSLGATTDHLAGQVQAWIELDFEAGNLAKTTGRGEITVTKGSLVDFDFLTALLAGDPGATRGTDTLSARFQLKDSAAHLLFLNLDSPSVKLRAAGSIGFDGMLNIRMSPKLSFTVLGALPGIGQIAEGLGKLFSPRALVGHFTHPVWRVF
ncbi:MAG: AsmA-like C-terminal region-containing protein [Planctomycetota bacterium]